MENDIKLNEEKKNEEWKKFLGNYKKNRKLSVSSKFWQPSLKIVMQIDIFLMFLRLQFITDCNTFH